MKEFQVAYLPIGVPTFHLESAKEQFEQSKQVIQEITDACIYPEEMLLGIDILQAFLDKLDPDLLIIQNITFANAAFTMEIVKRFSCPILLWTVREPVIDGGRLRLNSLTGAYSAANAMQGLQKKDFSYLYGSPKEELVKKKIKEVISAANIKNELTKLNIASIGHTPQGFGFGRAMDIEIQHIFGANLLTIEVRELINRAKAYSDEACMEEDIISKEYTVGMKKLPMKNQLAHIKLLKAYRDFIKENEIGALSSRCWPDLFVDYGTPVCAVLSLLNDLGVAASCEADTYGALSMFVGMKFSEKPVFFGDPVSLDEEMNTITYWHCGMAACTLARKDTGAMVGVHPNRKIGPAMDFGLMECDRVTVFRFGKDGKGMFRAFLATGKALNAPKQFQGTSVMVQTDNNAKELVYDSVKKGFEPHFVVIYADVAEEIKELCHMLGISVILY
jgi:L-fucose isomerase-like protein